MSGSGIGPGIGNNPSSPLLDPTGGSAGSQAQYGIFLQLLQRIYATLNAIYTVIPSSHVQGTTTNDNAPAGFIGEFASATLASGSAINFASSSTPRDVISMPLTSGDWDVRANIDVSNSSSPSSVQFASGWISATSATIPTRPDGSFSQQVLGGGLLTGDIALCCGPKRFSLASNTTVYLSGMASYSGGQMTGYGIITARRVR